MNRFRGPASLAVLLLVSDGNLSARPIPDWPPAPIQLPAPARSAGTWHNIAVSPGPSLPQIHFYDKLNPVWWLENTDEPVPPGWYLPGDTHRTLKWHFRNPFHNFDFYVIGIADKKFVRSGLYPEPNSNPRGGWDFAFDRRELAWLPFVSYERRHLNFYFGWREHGAFGLEFRFHAHPPAPSPRVTATAAG